MRFEWIKSSSWRSKRSDPAAGPDTRLGRLAGAAPLLHPPANVSREAALDVAVAGRLHNDARLDCHACLAGEATPLHCRGGKPGIRPGGRPAFCFAKKWGKKATPMMAPRCAGCTRRQHRNREASELAALRQPTLLIRFRHWRRVAIDGDPDCNGHCHCNGNGRCAGLTAMHASGVKDN